MPKIYISPRQGGKTTKAIEWLREQIAAGNDPVLVVRYAEDVHRLASQYGLQRGNFASLGSVRGRERALAGRHGPIGVDAEVNLQWLLGALLGTTLPVEFVALAENSATVDAPYFTWVDTGNEFVGAKRLDE